MNKSELIHLSRRLREYGYDNYRDYIASPLWQSRRARYYERHAATCVVCAASDTILHHRTYERVCAERDSDLVPLCGRCHDLVHCLKAGLSSGVRYLVKAFGRDGEVGLTLHNVAKYARKDKLAKKGVTVKVVSELSAEERERYSLEKPERPKTYAAWAQPRTRAADPHLIHWSR